MVSAVVAGLASLLEADIEASWPALVLEGDARQTGFVAARLVERFLQVLERPHAETPDPAIQCNVQIIGFLQYFTRIQHDRVRHTHTNNVQTYK